MSTEEEDTTSIGSKDDVEEPKTKKSKKDNNHSDTESSDDPDMPAAFKQLKKKVKENKKKNQKRKNEVETSDGVLITKKPKKIVSELIELSHCCHCHKVMGKIMVTFTCTFHYICMDCFLNLRDKKCPECQQAFPNNFGFNLSDYGVDTWKSKYDQYNKGQLVSNPNNDRDRNDRDAAFKKVFEMIMSSNGHIKRLIGMVYEKQCDGCKERVPLYDYDMHVKVNCPEIMVSCTNSGCNYSAKRKDYDNNHKANCDHRIVTCEVCQNDKLKYCDYIVHVKTCNDKKCNKCNGFIDKKIFDEHGKPCPLCKKHILCGQMEKHQDPEERGDCGEIDVNCSKCSKKIKRKDMSTHTATCCHCKKAIKCCERLSHQESCLEKTISCKVCRTDYLLKNKDTHTGECFLCKEQYVCCKKDEHDRNECVLRAVNCEHCHNNVAAKDLNVGPNQHKVRCVKCCNLFACSDYHNNHIKTCTSNEIVCMLCNQKTTPALLETHTVACVMCKGNIKCHDYYTSHLDSCPMKLMKCSDCSIMKASEHEKESHYCPKRKPVPAAPVVAEKKTSSSPSKASEPKKIEPSKPTSPAPTGPDPAIAKIEAGTFDNSTNEYLFRTYRMLDEPTNLVGGRISIQEDKRKDYLDRTSAAFSWMYNPSTNSNFMNVVVYYFEFIFVNSGRNNRHAWNKYQSAFNIARSSDSNDSRRNNMLTMMNISSRSTVSESSLPAYALQNGTYVLKY